MDEKRRASKRVAEELLYHFDFDIDELMETNPEMIKIMTFGISARLLENEKPKIEWVRKVDMYDAEEIMGDEDDFTPN